MSKFTKAIAAIMLMIAIVCATGCTKDPENGGNNNEGNNNGENGNDGNASGGTNEGMYVGIIGFNDVLKTMSIGLLNNSTENNFSDFINSLNMDDNTALYYADNTALNWLQNTTLPSDLINVSLLTFTDGLDNASLMLDGNYSSQEAYLNAINNRILNDRVQGKVINAYSIGLKGNNVTDEQDFQQKLRKLASNNSNVYLADNMDMVIRRFREIASQLYNEITTVNTNVKIPGGYDNNTTIRLTFDNVDDADLSTRYIQADFSRENGKGILSNVIYYDLQSTSGTSIISNSQEGASYWYTFSKLKTSSGLPMSNLQNMKLWIRASSGWRPEDEFTPSSYTNTTVTQKSAVAVLVLDCTTSLGTADFNKMKSAAIEFITTLNYNIENGSGNGGGNSGDGMLGTLDFVWHRVGYNQTGLAEFGLDWRMNSKDVFAQIYPLDGVTLFMFDSRAWNATTTEAEKNYLFQNTPSSSELSVYNNVSVWHDATYDDVIGTIMPNGTCYLIHVTKCEIESTTQGSSITISGQVK